MQLLRGTSIWLLKLVVVAVVFFALSRSSLAAFDIGLTEQRQWSDMSFPSATISYDAGTKKLSLATPGPPAAGDLEIGSEFGPLGSSRHYGNSGTLGGPFSDSLSIANVVLQPNGVALPGNGGNVLVTFGNGAMGSVGTDYTISSGASLLSGFVAGVKLRSTGITTIDIFFHITGGALQKINPDLGTNFSPGGLGLLRFTAAPSVPADFSHSFTFSSTAQIDLYGAPVPEFPYTTSVFLIAILGFGALSKKVLRNETSQLNSKVVDSEIEFVT